MDDWQESKHPRVKGGPTAGQFTSGGGGGAASLGAKAAKFAGTIPAGADPHTHLANKILGSPAQQNTDYHGVVAQAVKGIEKHPSAQHYVPALLAKLSEGLKLKAFAEQKKGNHADANKFMAKALQAHNLSGKPTNEFTGFMGAPAPAPKTAPAPAPAPAAASPAPPKAPESALLKALLAQTFEKMQANTGGKTMSQVGPLNFGKEMVKAAVQTSLPVQTIKNAMPTEALQAMTQQYGSVEIAYAKGMEYNAKKIEAEKGAAAAAEAQKKAQEAAKLAQEQAAAKAKAKQAEMVATFNSHQDKAKQHAMDVVGNFKGIGQQYAAQNPQLGLSVEDWSAIASYTDGTYGTLNESLRQGKMDLKWWAYAKTLDSALRKLPAHNGVTKRGASLPPEELARFEPGKVVEMHEFLSTTKHAEASFGSHKFTIHGQSGRDISKYSQHKSEGEVLFPYGTRFYVESKEQQGGVYHFVLREV